MQQVLYLLISLIVRKKFADLLSFLGKIAMLNAMASFISKRHHFSYAHAAANFMHRLVIQLTSNFSKFMTFCLTFEQLLATFTNLQTTAKELDIDNNQFNQLAVDSVLVKQDANHSQRMAYNLHKIPYTTSKISNF